MSCKFITFGVTAQGATHIKNHTPNQDSFCFYSDSECCVISVCDGHGSEKYVRSNIGAEIASNQTTMLMREFAASNNQLGKETEARRNELIDHLKRNILYYWHEGVTEHNSKDPLPSSDYTIAYGTTLISVLVTTEYVLCLQLGDGEIIFMDNNGDVSGPMSSDNRLLANETTSMCSDSAIHDFREYFSTELPTLITACTDGIPNSFVKYEDFLGLTKDISEELCSKGKENTTQLLKEGLARLSANGSGDDATLAVISILK